MTETKFGMIWGAETSKSLWRHTGCKLFQARGVFHSDSHSSLYPNFDSLISHPVGIDPPRYPGNDSWWCVRKGLTYSIPTELIAKLMYKSTRLVTLAQHIQSASDQFQTREHAVHSAQCGSILWANPPCDRLDKRESGFVSPCRTPLLLVVGASSSAAFLD